MIWKHIKHYIIVFAALGSVAGMSLGLGAFSGVAYAQSKSAVCAGIGAVNKGNGCVTTKGNPTINSLIDDIIDILSAVVAVISVIMVMWGGFRYVTSGGDSGKITAAKSTIVFALIGLAIAALAQTLVKFVLQKI